MAAGSTKHIHTIDGWNPANHLLSMKPSETCWYSLYINWLAGFLKHQQEITTWKIEAEQFGAWRCFRGEKPSLKSPRHLHLKGWGWNITPLSSLTWRLLENPPIFNRKIRHRLIQPVGFPATQKKCELRGSGAEILLELASPRSLTFPWNYGFRNPWEKVPQTKPAVVFLLNGKSTNPPWPRTPPPRKCGFNSRP